VQQQLSNAAGEPLSQQERCQLDFAGQLRSSSCHKARLLHYFPTNSGGQQQQQQQVAAGEDWCGWHLDHGALTGA
jgi:isopenicillin N synthase-like dioxygenase